MAFRIPNRIYHGTGILQLAEIISSGYLEVCDDDDHDDSGVVGASLTTDRDVAQKFADEAKDRDWQGEWNSPVNDGVVLVFDARSLEKFVSLVSVTWDGSSAESEIRTRGRIYDPLRFLQSVEADADAIRWWIGELEECGEMELVSALRDARLAAIMAVPPDKAMRSRV
ncbi:hypothetical protein G6L37_02970 [Agrobacterium rubi]|nr:hypothetical protein [Agrobacterium rubi]NTF24340.1 hypothetical protein [Agrobacterium rubi]